MPLCLLIAALAGAQFVHAQKASSDPSPAQCLQDICGGQFSYKDIKRPQEHIHRAQSDYLTQIEPLLVEGVEKSMDLEKSRHLRLFPMIASKISPNFVLPDHIRARINLAYLFDLVESAPVANAISYVGDKLQIDQPKLKKHFQKEGVEDPDRAIALIRQLLESELMSWQKIAEKNMKLSTLYRIYLAKGGYSKSFKDFIEELILYMRQADAAYATIKYNAGSPFFLLKRYENHEPIGDEDSAEMFEELGLASIMLASAPPMNNEKATPMYEGLVSLKRNYFKVIQDQLKKLKWNPKPFASEIVSTKQVCSQRYQEILKLMPTDSELRSFKMNFLPESIEAMARVLGRKNLAGLIPTLGEIEWNFQSTYSKVLKRYRLAIQDEIDRTRVGIENNELLLQELAKGDQEALAIAVAILMNSTENSPAELEARACERLEVPTPADNSLAIDSAVSVSWLSVIGVSPSFTLGHEMGHYFESRWENLGKEHRACLASKHSQLEDFAALEGEDLADLFGFELEREMKMASNANTLCYYTNLERAALLRKKSDDDPHSTDLFRLISYAVEQDKLPPSCRTYLKAVGANNLSQKQCTSRR